MIECGTSKDIDAVLLCDTLTLCIAVRCDDYVGSERVHVFFICVLVSGILFVGRSGKFDKFP